MNSGLMRQTLAVCLSLVAFGGPALAQDISVVNPNRVTTANTFSLITSDQTTVVGDWSSQIFQFDPATAPPGVTPGVSTLTSGGGFVTMSSGIASGTQFGSFHSNMSVKAWDGDGDLGGGAAAAAAATFSASNFSVMRVTGSWSVPGALQAGATPFARFRISLPTGTTVYQSQFLPSAPGVDSGVINFELLMQPRFAYIVEAQLAMSYSRAGGNFGAQEGHLNFTLSIPSPGTTFGFFAVGTVLTVRRRR